MADDEIFYGTLSLDTEYTYGEGTPIPEMPEVRNIASSLSFWALRRHSLQGDVKPLRLETGDLVKTFNSITDGEVWWSGEINLEYTRERHSAETGYTQQAVFGFWVHGLQASLPPKAWARMFHEEMPASLLRDGKTIHGKLEPFFETGTEGVLWAVHEYNKPGYEGLNILKNGDRLTVYSKVFDGEVAAESTLQLSPLPGKVAYHPQYVIDVANMPQNNDPAPNTMARLFVDRHPAIIRKRKP